MNRFSIKKEKSRVQAEQQFIYLIMNIIETYPQYTIPQHICHFMRKKSSEQEAYHWDTEEFLKKVEDYYDELNNEISKTPSED